MIKLFTHTDLDGIGCAILAYLAFGRENVDVEYCDYKNINENVREFYLNERDKIYDVALITDISINEEVAEQLNMIVEIDGRWILLDHHATALGLNKYKWCTVKVTNESTGINTSGTELLYQRLLRFDYFDPYNKRVCNNIRRFVDIVRDYDTWRWKELGDEGIVCKQLNDLFHM